MVDIEEAYSLYKEKYLEIYRRGLELYGFRENPFSSKIMLNYITDRKEFINEFATVMAFYRKGTVFNLYIHGERGIGKSFILKVFESILQREREFCVAYCDCKSQFASLPELIQEKSPISKKIKNLLIKEDMEDRISAIETTHAGSLVLLLDGIDDLRTRDREIVKKMIANSEVLIIATSTGFDSDIASLFKKKMMMDKLSIDFCIELLKKRMSGFRIDGDNDIYPFTEDALYQMAILSRGNPYRLLNIATVCLYEGLKNSWEEITDSHIVRFLYSGKNSVILHFSPSQRRILEAIYFLGPSTAEKIAEFLGITRVAVTKHVQQLMECGAILRRKMGKRFMIYLHEDYKKIFDAI